MRNIDIDEAAPGDRRRRRAAADAPRYVASGAVTLEELKQAVADGTVDTVLLAIADMEGRLQGKRLTASHFLDEVLEHGAEGCNYLLAVDVDMETVGGYAMSSWERGYGDFEMKPDLDTLRPVPWHEGTVLLLADLAVGRRLRGRRLAAADPAPPARPPRRARAGSPTPAPSSSSSSSTTPTRTPGRTAYRDLEPANLYNIDYSLLGTARVEPLIRRIRNEMAAAGMTVENSKGECNLGQHEINFRYGEALAAADDHAIYKNGAKEIAAQEEHGDHLHGEVQRARGQLVPHPLLARRRGRRRTRSAPTRRCSTASSPASSPACAS